MLSGAPAARFVGSLTNTIVGIALPTIAGELGTSERVAELSAQVADSVRASCTAGLAPVLLVAAPLAAAALAAVLLVRETPLDARG
ncbi:hypothetical protein C4J65_34440 [Streptomyces sp. CB09001]|uniref:hypothetical protein n=1 Tax=unclassified Streptomyces TaxID=2593676 RepID=UPI000E20C92B|nr:hypothetical protein [Streptomyces sp. CB09001]AXL92817.1 hypothetical protein C4J65_34440 [Streptomyces sp. CB09001]